MVRDIAEKILTVSLSLEINLNISTIEVGLIVVSMLNRLAYILVGSTTTGLLHATM